MTWFALYLVAVGVGLILWIDGPLYGIVDSGIWVLLLCGQICIGGMMLWRRSRFR